MYSEDRVIEQALAILWKRLRKSDDVFSNPDSVKSYLTLKFAQRKKEIFGALWLTVENRLITFEEMFSGTLTQCSVYPREVLKSALKCNAASVIFFHNHPSGNSEPSEADKTLTDILKRALRLIDVKVLDHMIVGNTQTLSFAERGLM